MKFLSILILSLFISASSLFAQDKTEETAPDYVQKTFNKKFPKARSVSWQSISDGQWEAKYKMGEINYWSTYAKNGHWRETTKEIEVSDLELNVIAVLDRKYDTYSITEAKLVENKDGDSFNIRIDQAGKIIALMVDSEGHIKESDSEAKN